MENLEFFNRTIGCIFWLKVVDLLRDTKYVRLA